MIGQNNLSVSIMQVYTVLIHTKPLLRNGKGFERQLNKGNGEHNTSHQHVDLEKSARKQNCCLHPAQDQNILMKPVTLILIQHYLGVLRLRL